MGGLLNLVPRFSRPLNVLELHPLSTKGELIPGSLLLACQSPTAMSRSRPTRNLVTMFEPAYICDQFAFPVDKRVIMGGRDDPFGCGSRAYSPNTSSTTLLPKMAAPGERRRETKLTGDKESWEMRKTHSPAIVKLHVDHKPLRSLRSTREPRSYTASGTR